MGYATEADVADWAETAIEEACHRAEEWYQALPKFSPRVNLGSVVGFRHPALVSEHDCVIHFARFLNEARVPWDAIHHQVSASRWLFDHPHPRFRGGRLRVLVHVRVRLGYEPWLSGALHPRLLEGTEQV